MEVDNVEEVESKLEPMTDNSVMAELPKVLVKLAS